MYTFGESRRVCGEQVEAAAQEIPRLSPQQLSRALKRLCQAVSCGLPCCGRHMVQISSESGYRRRLLQAWRRGVRARFVAGGRRHREDRGQTSRSGDVLILSRRPSRQSLPVRSGRQGLWFGAQQGGQRGRLSRHRGRNQIGRGQRCVPSHIACWQAARDGAQTEDAAANVGDLSPFRISAVADHKGDRALERSWPPRRDSSGGAGCGSERAAGLWPGTCRTGTCARRDRRTSLVSHRFEALDRTLGDLSEACAGLPSRANGRNRAANARSIALICSSKKRICPSGSLRVT